jgi:hypothetical protein
LLRGHPAQRSLDRDGRTLMTPEAGHGRFSPGAFRSLFAGRRILWQCFFGAYCVGLDLLLPIELVRSLDDGSDLDLIRDRCGIHFATVEHANNEGRRRNWIGASIDVGFEQCRAAVEDRLRAHRRDSWWLTSSPSSGRLAAYCREHGYGYVGPSLESQQRFQAKSCLLEICHDLRLPRVKGEWCSLQHTTHAELARHLGQPLVLQTARGAAGSGTRLVRSEADLRHVAPFFGDEPVLVSSYLGPVSLNINAAVIGGEPFVGPPSVQLAGLDALGAPWGGYCGNDYSAATGLDRTLIAAVQDQTDRIGWWMAARGFEGLYGLDFVVSEQDGRAYAVDLNPRWQGSTALSIQAELARGRLPLAAAEFACRARVISPADVKMHADDFRRPLTGAQMCLRAPRDRRLRVAGDPRPGVYESAAKPRFVTSGFRLADCAGDDQWLVTCGVPRTGTQVEPGAWLARIYTDRPVVGPDSATLSPWASQVAAHALASLGLVTDSAAGSGA